MQFVYLAAILLARLCRIWFYEIMLHLRKLLFLLVFSALFSQCGFFETKPYQPEKPASRPDLPVNDPLPQPVVIHSTQGSSCAELLATHGLVAEKSNWVLKSAASLSAADFVQKIEKAGPDLFESKACSGNSDYQIYYQGSKLSYQAVIQKQNYDLLKNKKISQPEFYRRLRLEKVGVQKAFESDLLLLLKNKNYKDALELVQNKLKEEKKSNSLKLLQAKLMVVLKDYFNALERLNKLSEKNAQVLYLKGFALQELGRFDEAVQSINRILELPVDQQAQLSQMAITQESLEILLLQIHLKNNQPLIAEDVLKKIGDKSSFPVIVQKVIWLRLKKSYQKALDTITDWNSEGEKQDLFKHYYQTLLSVDLRDQNKAVEAYQKLKELKTEWAKDFEFLDQAKKLPLEDVEVIGSLVLFEVAYAQAIPPSEQVVSETKSTTDPQNLPYQPKELDEISEDLQNLDSTSETTEETKVKEIDWQTIPYIPSRFPELDLGMVTWSED